MGKTHGFNGTFKIDSPAGALQDASALLRKADPSRTTDRPETTTFTQDGERNEVTGLRDASIALEGFYARTTTKVHGRATVVFLGAYDVSSYFDSGTVKRGVDLPETQTFSNAWKRREVVGIRHDSLSLGGFHDRASNASYDLLRAALAAASGDVVSVGYNGAAIGELVELLAIATEKHDITLGESDVVKTSAEFKADGGVLLGVSLHALSAETGAAAFSSVDETAATANGGIAHLHVTAVGGAGTATIKLQHSADNAAWADLGSFTVTAVGGQRLEIAKGTTVNQYVRANLTDLSTFTSLTFTMAFARRNFASATSAGAYRHWASLYGASATSTVELGPDGSTAGLPKLTGEFRLSELTSTFSENDPTTFSATLVSDSTVTETTW